MRRALVLLVPALLLGGCWADSDDDPVTAGEAPTEQAEPGDPPTPDDPTPDDPTTTTEAGPPPTFADDGPNVPPEGAPTADELEAVMPDPAILGDRFEMALEPLSDMDDSEIAAPFCDNGWPGNHLSELHEPHDVGGISAGYAYDEEDEDEGPLVVVRAASFPDAVGHVRDAAAQIEACAAAEPDDVPTGTFVVDDDPGLGDVSLAYRLEGELDMGAVILDLTLHMTLVAVGDVVVFVQATDHPDIPQAPPREHLDLDALEAFVAQVVDGVAGLR